MRNHLDERSGRMLDAGKVGFSNGGFLVQKEALGGAAVIHFFAQRTKGPRVKAARSWLSSTRSSHSFRRVGIGNSRTTLSPFFHSLKNGKTSFDRWVDLFPFTEITHFSEEESK